MFISGWIEFRWICFREVFYTATELKILPVK